MGEGGRYFSLLLCKKNALSQVIFFAMAVIYARLSLAACGCNHCCCAIHLCPGLNAVTNFANFTIFRFSFKFNKFCDFSLNSTRYTKIRCLNDFSVRCAEIYNFMLIDHQAPACRFYKIYKIYDFLLTLRFFQ